MLKEVEQEVEYNVLNSLPAERGIKHRIVDVTIRNAQSPDVEIDVAQLGVRRLTHMTPQPLDGFWGIVWNGDVEQPVLSIDPYPERATIRVRIEVLGR